MAVTQKFMVKISQIRLTASPKIFSVNDLVNDLGGDVEKVSAFTATIYR